MAILGGAKMSDGFSHLNDQGEVHMVDVGHKPVTLREATAAGVVEIAPETADRLFAGSLPKGDALASVRLAAIMGAKRTSDLIPLCHPISISAVDVLVARHPQGAEITARVQTTGQTGVEMEAMTAVAVGALTLYDMIKGLDRSASIGAVRLIAKSGGASGTWMRSNEMGNDR
jgi:cyclic pyranopterin monophosphate synthase